MSKPHIFERVFNVFVLLVAFTSLGVSIWVGWFPPKPATPAAAVSKSIASVPQADAEHYYLSRAEELKLSARNLRQIWTDAEKVPNQPAEEKTVDLAYKTYQAALARLDLFAKNVLRLKTLTADGQKDMNAMRDWVTEERELFKPRAEPSLRSPDPNERIKALENMRR